MGGKRTESPCPLEPTQTAEILEEQSCIWLISPTKTRLCGCGTAACDHLICNSLWLSCNWGSLSAQPLHSQQPGINKRRRFPWASSSGISVSTAHTFIKFCLSIYLSTVLHTVPVLQTTFFTYSLHSSHVVHPQVHREQPNQVHITQRLPRSENPDTSVSMLPNCQSKC